LNITEVSTAALLKFFKPLLPVLDDMAAVSEIPDYDAETEYPPLAASPSPYPVTSRSRELHTPKPWSPQAEATSWRPSAFSTTEGGVGGEVETSTEGGLSGDEQASDESNISQSTAYIAIGGILIGLLIVVASIFIVNRRRKSSQPEIRKTSNGHIYDPVRRSVGRPASFSPEVAKRLSENGVTPPLPVFSTFRNSLSSPDCESPETIILEETETAAAK
jgi:hypothetical protein